MEIRDVIGSLREKDLDLQDRINALRLDIHLLEYRLSNLERVSRETKGDNGNGDSPEQLQAADPSSQAEAGVGPKRVRKQHKVRD